MKQSYIGVVFVLIVVSIYSFYASTYGYVSNNEDEHGNTTEIGNVHEFQWFSGINDSSNREKSMKTEKNKKQTNMVTLNICCGINQVMDATSNDCIDMQSEMSNKVQYLLDMFVVESNMGHGIISSPHFEYGVSLQNGCANGELLRFEWKYNKTSLYFIEQDTGNLLELNQKTKKILSSFTNKAYCLDKSIDKQTYVALVCPCSEKACVPKCCQKGFYFNTIENTCKGEAADDIQSYSPDLYNANEKADTENYYLIQRKLNCTNPKLFIEPELNMRQLYVQVNGSLQTQLNDDKYYYLDNNKYCVDMFSTGKENQTLVNGLYCSVKNEENSTPNKENSMPNQEKSMLNKEKSSTSNSSSVIGSKEHSPNLYKTTNTEVSQKFENISNSSSVIGAKEIRSNLHNSTIKEASQKFESISNASSVTGSSERSTTKPEEPLWNVLQNLFNSSNGTHTALNEKANSEAFHKFEKKQRPLIFNISKSQIEKQGTAILLTPVDERSCSQNPPVFEVIGMIVMNFLILRT